MRARQPLVGAAVEDLLPSPDGNWWTEAGVLDAHEALLLQGLQTLAPIDTQAAALQRRLGLEADGIVDLKDDLNALLDRNLLLSTDALSDESRPPKPLAITSTAILSCDRPAMLQRAIRDLGAPAHACGRRLLVSDDTARPLQPPAAPAGTTLEWLNRRHRDAWIDKLPDRELQAVARDALLPEQDGDTTVGANCNAVFLATQSELLALLDDDVCAPVGRALPSEPQRWVIGDDGDPTQLLLYEHIDNAVGELVTGEADPSSLLEQGLGQSVQELLASQPLDFENFAPAASARAALRGGRVLTSMMGVAGDNGMSSPLSYLGLTEDAGRRLDQNFREHIISRNVIRAADCRRLTRSTFFMNACCGLDLRDGLLPFFPKGRESDGLFGLSLRQIQPDAFRLYLPWAATHRPPPREPYDLGGLLPATAAAPPVALLKHATAAWHPPRTLMQRNHRLEALGVHLEALGQLDRALLLDYMREARLGELAERIRWLGQLLGRAPEIRHRIIEACLINTQERLKQLAAAPLDGVCIKGLTPQDYADALTGYGRLLQCWDGLLQAAREMPLQGDEIAG